MNNTHANIAMQFDDAEQQHSAATFGMWVFLTTEVLFFGGMIVAYCVYRFQYPDMFQAASQHVNLWAGCAMTAILLLGSLLVAMSDHLMEHHVANEAETSDSDRNQLRRVIVRRLAITVVFGVAFLTLEMFEYRSLIHEGLFPGSSFRNGEFASFALDGRSAQLFFVLFFCMTGLHGLHMIIGIALVSGLAIAFKRSENPERLRNPLKVIGLYWHFVDIVWIFLYPLFYLVR